MRIYWGTEKFSNWSKITQLVTDNENSHPDLSNSWASAPNQCSTTSLTDIKCILNSTVLESLVIGFIFQSITTSPKHQLSLTWHPSWWFSLRAHLSVSSTNSMMTFSYLRTLLGEIILASGLFQINGGGLTILCPVIWQGVRPGHSVHTSEPGSELAVWAHQHRPAHRLQIQYGCDDNRGGPQQCAVPGPHRRRSDQAPGRAPPGSLVRSPNPLSPPQRAPRDRGTPDFLAFVSYWRPQQAGVSGSGKETETTAAILSRKWFSTGI